ncbi:hypothetical protein LCL61_25520 [Amycolatopsis coloradensis]|uniref:Uncharacterized protein n=1 Tax=Amycolatopsis coloradensis TaxID=76021 RepID=A0ACD5BI15_9PSEU
MTVAMSGPSGSAGCRSPAATGHEARAAELAAWESSSRSTAL